MKVSVILGSGEALDQACATAVKAGLAFKRLDVSSVDRFNFDLTPLFKNYIPADTAVFVALDARAVNLARHKLIAEVRLKGYALLNIVASDAALDEEVRLMGNVYVGAGSFVAGPGVLGAGCWLGKRVLVEAGCRIGACASLGTGVVLNGGTEIGTGTSLGAGSFTVENARIGRYCEWLLSGLVPERLPDRSFYDALMPDGARILGR